MNGISVNADPNTINNVGVTWGHEQAIFDGSDYMTRTSSVSIPAATDFSMYVRFATNVNPSGFSIIAECVGSGAYGFAVYILEGGQLHFKVGGGGTSVDATTPGSSYNDGSYHYAIISFTGSAVSFATDLESSSDTFSKASTDALITIGRSRSGTGKLTGDISDAKMWRAARTISTVADETDLVFKMAYNGTDFYDASQTAATIFDFGKVQNDTASTAIDVDIANEDSSATSVQLTMPEGFSIREKGVGSYVSEITSSIDGFDETTFEVIAYPTALGTIREVMNLYYSTYNRTYDLISESVMSEYMTIKVEDDGIEVGRLEKNVIILHREKLINTETDRAIVNETPTTETRIITPPTGTNALLIYSKWSDPDEYWRLRVADLSTTALANEGDTLHFSLASTTMSEGSRMWYSAGSVLSDFAFFDRSTSPYVEVDTDIGYRTIDVADNDYIKVTAELNDSVTPYPFTLTSIDTPHLLAYIPLVFGDKVLVQVDKTDKEFEIICLKEV